MNTFFYKDIAYPDGVIGGKDYYNPVIYSTNERLIGVGENNKPLYQKTIESGSIPADSDTTTGLTNIESYHVIAIEVINLSNNTEYAPNQISMYNYQGAGTWYGNVFLANNELKFNNNSRTNAIKVRAVIQYTKTTDTAGSAPYNNNGVPTVRYTTDEQIIGLWTDGKPLYRRVFNLNQSISNYQWTENILGTTGTGIYITDYKGFYIAGETMIPIDWNRSTASNSCTTTNDYNDDIHIRPNLDGITPIVKYIIVEYTKTTD